MDGLPQSLRLHRIQSCDPSSVLSGRVVYAPAKSLWFIGMAVAAAAGCAATFSWSAVLVFLVATGSVLLLGHSLGSHRKLIHDSYGCPRWLERFLVYMGVQVGLAGPLGLLRQHELRDYAQRLPDCHAYLRHGSAPWKDAWWQLNCELRLDDPPQLQLEPRVAQDRFYLALERTWMLQQIPPAMLLFLWGGWAFVFWGVCARITAGVFGHWLIGYFAHNHGPMHFAVDGAAVQGRNIRWTSLLTMGECWHNNHHAFPGSARLGLAAGEWDPGWWMLMAMRRAGLVWDLRLPADLPARAELRPLDRLPDPETSGKLPSVVRLWRLSRVRGTPMTLECPGAHAGSRTLARMAGPGATVKVNPGARRLWVHAGSQRVVGLPGLWLAVAMRSAWHRRLVLAALPLAIAAEAVRTFFTPTLVPGVGAHR